MAQEGFRTIIDVYRANTSIKIPLNMFFNVFATEIHHLWKFYLSTITVRDTYGDRGTAGQRSFSDRVLFYPLGTEPVFINEFGSFAGIITTRPTILYLQKFGIYNPNTLFCHFKFSENPLFSTISSSTILKTYSIIVISWLKFILKPLNEREQSLINTITRLN